MSRWRDSGHLERAAAVGGQEAFDAAIAAMLGDARGWRLAEIRERRGITQEQVAVRMGVSVARVSQIEHGDVSTMDVLTATNPRSAAPSSSSPTTSESRSPEPRARAPCKELAARPTVPIDGLHRNRRPRRGTHMHNLQRSPRPPSGGRRWVRTTGPSLVRRNKIRIVLSL